MLIKTVKVDIESMLDDLWCFYMADLKSSADVASDLIEFDELVHEDRMRIKNYLECLHKCNLIDAEEVKNMKKRADDESRAARVVFENRVKINKED